MPPQDCVKRWGSCSGIGAASFRDEVIVTPARNGGRQCTLEREFGKSNRELHEACSKEAISIEVRVLFCSTRLRAIIPRLDMIVDYYSHFFLIFFRQNFLLYDFGFC